MIAIIDYEIGNLRSVQKALEKAGGDAQLTRDPAAIASAAGVVLPGVGAFRDCMAGLERFGLVEAAKRAATGPRPFLGICVGMQMLFETSDEFGITPGLGIVPGTVQRFAPDMPDPESPGMSLKIPLMGWNTIQPARADDPLFAGIASPCFYFVHSYYVKPARASDCDATARYGIDYCVAVSDPQRNIYGTQFHPEKSQQAGLAVLSNFVRMCA